jgi:hypothetical protein
MKHDTQRRNGARHLLRIMRKAKRNRLAMQGAWI